MIRFAAACLVALGPLALSAQSKDTPVAEGWRSSLTPGDVAYVGWAHTVPQGDLFFSCGGTMAGGPLNPERAHPAFPYAVTLEFRHAALGTGTPGQARSDLSVRIDDTVYTLPTAWFDPNNRAPIWYLHLSMGDALFADLMDGGAFELRQGGTPVQTHHGAIGASLEDAMRFCIAQYGAVGLPVPDHAAGVVARLRGGTAAGPAVDQRMNAAAAAICEAPFHIDPASVERPDLDHDGVPDAVLFWGGVDCLSGSNADLMGAGYCGVSQCLTSFFLSGSPAPGPDAEIYFAAILTDPARPGQIGLVSRLAVCQQLALGPDCTQWADWAGGDLRILP